MFYRDRLDYGDNAKIVYSTTGGNGSSLFTVHPSTGWITVSSSISGRKRQNYSLDVTASDKGTPPRATLVHVYLFVNGINHEAPRFITAVFQRTIPENRAVGADITTVMATDADEGLNGDVWYYITAGNDQGLFQMDKITGRLSIAKPLDYDTQPVHRLTISARDRGMLYRETTKVFTISLSDVNDNAPTFNESVYQTYLPENSVIGSTVFVANATDLDSGINAVIEYAIIGDPEARNLFSINAQTGVVTTRAPKSKFDYEVKNRYRLVILARNPGTNLESSTQVDVNIAGVNEFLPQFVQRSYSFAVSESAGAGASVGRVYATDRDDGEDGVVYYYLLGESNEKGFRVDPNSGVIYVTTPPDRESNAQISLTVLVKNHGPLHGNDTDLCTVTMVIQDANDPPVFTNGVYDAYVKENRAADVSVTTVKAVDSDLLPEHQKFSYAILAGNLGQKFKIDPLGVIRTTTRLDRESIPVYNVTVGAIDTGSPPATGSAVVRITILDENDNGPMFVPKLPAGTVAENSPPGTSVMTLTSVTSDPDLAPNQGPYTYNIPASNWFTVEQTTGILRTKLSLDRESKAVYLVPVIVQDAGTPRMSSTLTAQVLVQDVNDNPSLARPLLVQVYSFQGQPSGTIADVRPLDPDLTGTYRCTKISGEGAFSVESGCRLTSLPLREDASYSLNISGSDGVHSEVNSPVTVVVKTITNATLDNTIIIQLAKMTEEKFLSKIYTDFLSSLTNLFTQGSKILIYHLQQNGENLNVFLAVEKPQNGYHYQSVLETQFVRNRDVIRQQSGADILVANYNPCNINPCHNSAECRNTMRLYLATVSSDSPKRVISSPSTNSGFLCVCQQGFYGQYCNVSLDSCGTNPCKHGGKCHTLSGGSSYKCECPPSWRGQHCTEDVNECAEQSPCRNGGHCSNSRGSYQCTCVNGYTGDNCENKIDFCRTAPCLNGGVCQSLASSYRCDCTFGTSGLHCEHTSLGFAPLSAMEFRRLNETDNWISIEFSTVMADALLLYNPGPRGKDYLALQLVRGKVKLSYALGDQTTTELVVDKLVNDGNWHRVEAVRRGSVSTLFWYAKSLNFQFFFEIFLRIR